MKWIKIGLAKTIGIAKENHKGNLIKRTFSIMQVRADKHFDKGADFAKLGDLEKAVALFDKALTLDPGNDMLWVLRGSILDDLGRYSDSLDSYDKALDVKQDYAVAWYSRGVVLRKLGRYAEAVKSLDRALALNPNYADAKKHREQAARECDKGM